MSSTLRSIKEPTNLRRQFMIQQYEDGINGYFFTASDNTLSYIETDLSGADWTVARDMGTQRVITELSPALKSAWETANGWSNIRVIRPGIARKFQVLALVRGNRSVSDENGPAWNAGAYLRTNNTPIYNYETNTVNDMMVVGRSDSISSGTIYESLPFGTFWAMNDPLVIEYVFSDVTYRRAIKHRIDETTLL